MESLKISKGKPFGKATKLSSFQFIDVAICILILVQCLVLPLINFRELMFAPISSKTIVFITSMLLIFVLLGVKCMRAPLVSFKLNAIDFLLTFLIGYILLNGVNVSNRFLELIGLLVFYFSIRTLKNKYIIYVIVAIILSTIIQSVYGLLQLWGILESQHVYFRVTASFFNPGPFAGYLASSFPLILGLFLVEVKNNFQNDVSLLPLSRYLKIIALIALVLIFIILPATHSRAAFLSIVISSIVLVSIRYSLSKLIKQISKFKLFLFLLLSMILLILGCLFLYKYKSGSANGRLLIWDNALSLIGQKPITGVGFDKFKSVYMLEQADFFKNNLNSSFNVVAGDVEYCFNDILQFVVENGIIGFLILIALLCVLFKKSVKPVNGYFSSILKVAIIGVVLFGLFSYPTQIIAIKVNMFCYLALLAKMNTRCEVDISLPNITRVSKYVLSVIFIGFVFFSANFIHNYYVAYKNWNKAYQLYFIGDYVKGADYYLKAYSYLSSDGEYLTNYGKTLVAMGDNNTADLILHNAIDAYPNIVAFAALGDNYKVLKHYELSEECYMNAFYMNPSRFYTLYLLARLYDETDQNDKAIRVASDILAKNIKVESSAIDEIKAEMRELLYRRSKK